MSGAASSTKGLTDIVSAKSFAAYHLAKTFEKNHRIDRLVNVLGGGFELAAELPNREVVPEDLIASSESPWCYNGFWRML